MFLVIPLSKTETWQEHGKVHLSDLIKMISTDIYHGHQMKDVLLQLNEKK